MGLALRAAMPAARPIYPLLSFVDIGRETPDKVRNETKEYGYYAIDELLGLRL